LNKRKGKTREPGIKLYSVSWETENEQMAIKNVEIYKYEKKKTKNFMAVKVDRIGSSYWEILKRNDARRRVGSGKSDR